MESRCWPYLSILSGAGCFFLVYPTQACCGIAVKAEFSVIGLKVPLHYADSSLLIAAVYLILCVAALAVTLSKQTERQGDHSESGDVHGNKGDRFSTSFHLRTLPAVRYVDSARAIMEEQKVPEAVAPPQKIVAETVGTAPDGQLEHHDSFERPQSTSRYFQAMHEFRYVTSDLGVGFSVQTGDQEELGIADPARLNKEIRNFARDSPCESAAAIFVAMDTSRMHLMRALISGPEDTPYAHGLYAFDIGLRESYPTTPPVVKIATTGESRARFNPNLYNDGYVCLSIINTWEASPEEMWNPSTSTLLQVLLSIQSLVMDNEVLQKEPGYEMYSAQDPGNLAYSAVVKYNNVKYAMRKMIQHPPEEFKEVVWRHFSLKREEIVRTCENWVEEARSLTDFTNIDYLAMDHNTHTISKFQEKGYLNRLSKHVDKLKTALRELPPVP